MAQPPVQAEVKAPASVLKKEKKPARTAEILTIATMLAVVATTLMVSNNKASKPQVQAGPAAVTQTVDATVDESAKDATGTELPLEPIRQAEKEQPVAESEKNAEQPKAGTTKEPVKKNWAVKAYEWIVEELTGKKAPKPEGEEGPAPVPFPTENEHLKTLRGRL
ncbi:Uncharacterised protein [uncultured archaeon]|nr:Uncharacterised protein [uncultured archaeon]